MLRRLVEAHPEWPDARLLLTRLLWSKRADDWEEIVRLSEGVPAAYTMRTDALTKVAKSRLAADDPEGALAAAKEALAARPRDVELMGMAGRAAVELSRLDEGEAYFRQALGIEPEHPAIHEALAQLVWMRTADPAKAMAEIEARLAMAPAEALWWLKPRVASFVSGPEAAAGAALEAARRHPGNPSFALMAAQCLAEADRGEEALAFAAAVQEAAPDSPAAIAAMLQAALASGQTEWAVWLAEQLRAQRAPSDQFALAAQATAWRVAGDPRFDALYDYVAMVRSYRLETPDGWSSLDGYLADLREALLARHVHRTHPFQQSIRHGSQTMRGLLGETDPVIAAFFPAVAKAVDQHLAHLGPGEDPLRSRNSGAWRFQGAWSVKLDGGGRHLNHVHQDGWLSSAFYVATPDQALGRDGREGWIKFGEPGLVTRPRLEPQHFVKPEPGTVVLFPSYMWHGTEPFSGDETRLTIAFDVVPR